MEKLILSEKLIEECPDSALAMLSGIEKNNLKGDKEKARYALLMSMALDKNYIDTTTFKIIQPAIDYYLKKGSPDDKLKTRYYQGRIYQNVRDNDNALSSFMKGLDSGAGANDSALIARTLVAQGLIYLNIYNIDNYIDCNRRAAEIYGKLRDIFHENDCRLNLINGYINNGDEFKADSLIRVCENNPIFDKSQTNRFKRLRLGYAINFGSEGDISNLLEAGDETLISDINSLLVLALAHHKINDNVSAQKLLDYVSDSGITYDTLKYKAIYVSVLKDIADYKEALSMYESFNQMNDSINGLIFDQKTRILTEKHKIELKVQEEQQSKIRILWGGLFSLSLLGMTIAILAMRARSIKAEKTTLTLENKNLQLEHQKKVLEVENLAHRVKDLENERESLKNLLDEKNELPEEVLQVIRERVEIQNSQLAGYITNSTQHEQSYDNWIRKTTEDVEGFMNSNRLAFQASHPKFIKYFESHGLSTSEINYVCLYAIGLRGKEVGNYMKKRGHVNISSAIRKKLGIDKHETNLGIYVRKLLKEC